MHFLGRLPNIEMVAKPSALSLKGISKKKLESDNSSTPPTKEKKTDKIYSTDNFPEKWTFFEEFMKNHPDVSKFLGEKSMQNFYNILDYNFFNWLNNRKKSIKSLYEIKREYMNIAEKVLLLEITNKQRSLTPHGFVIGPFQKYLEAFGSDKELGNLGVIPYSRPLCSPPISKLEDTRLHIREDKIRLSGVEDSFDMDDNPDFDVSSFFVESL